MPKITSLIAKSSKIIAKSSKIIAHLDDGSRLPLPESAIIDFKLKPNKEIPQKLLEKLRTSSVYQQAYTKALNLISYRPRSSNEIRKRLKEISFPEEIINTVIEKLTTQGYLNDQDFITNYLSSLIENHPQGPLSLKQKLYSKGIDSSKATEYINKLLPDTNSLVELAQKIYDKKIHLWNSLSPQKHHQKAYQYLYNQGFPGHIINQIINSLRLTTDSN